MIDYVKFNIIITASYIPTHPSIKIIKKTIESLDKIGPVDGHKIKVILAHDYSEEKNYKEYLSNLQDYCNIRNKNNKNFYLKIVVRRTHGHLVGNVRRSLKYVNSKYILVIQHDLMFCREFNIQSILHDMIKFKNLKHVRFNKRTNIEKGYDKTKVPLWNKYNIRGNNNYISTFNWSDNNHLCPIDYYKDVVMNLCENGKPMEYFLYKRRKKKSLNDHLGTYVYGELNEPCVIRHLDGRLTKQ